MRKKILLSILFTMIISIVIALGGSTNVFADTGEWRTYDDIDSNITYSSYVTAVNESGNYKSTYHGFNKGKKGETAKFNFTGNKLRICGLKSSNYSTAVLIKIDEKKYYFSAYSSSNIYQASLFNIENLSEGEHSVVIENENPTVKNDYTFDFRIDSIKVDSDDMILPYNETQSKAVLKIGTDCTATLNKDVSVNLYMDNVTNIGAVSAVVKYDASKLQFISLENVEGIRTLKLIKENGQIELILSCNSEEDFINTKKVIAKMHFKAIGRGSALVDVVSGKISDCETMDRSLTNIECGYEYLPII